MKRKEWQLRNGRMNDQSSAIHDLYLEDELILEGKSYDECRQYVYDNGAKEDIYSEPDCVPDYAGDTIYGLLRAEELRSEILKLMDSNNSYYRLWQESNKQITDLQNS